jgi:hypothetical protein
MAQVNGDKPSSAFLNHLYSYPLISDTIKSITSTPLGAKSLDLTTTSYEKTLKPLLPYFSTPYSYVSPYIQRVDTIGDSTLSTLDSKFPTVKKPTHDLIEEGKAIVFFPVKLGNEGKDYVVGVFGNQKKKAGGEGVVNLGKAVVSTGLIVSGDAVHWLSEFLSKKKVEVKEVVHEKTQQ